MDYVGWRGRDDRFDAVDGVDSSVPNETSTSTNEE
jgi:hypothetical protein